MPAPPKSKIWSYLSNHGPATTDELPGYVNITPELRSDGVQKFAPKAHTRTGEIAGMIRYSVYYIDGKHDPETVIKTWLDVNEGALEPVSDWAIHQSISDAGSDFKEASYELLGPFEAMSDRGGNTGYRGGTCDLCGDEYDGYYPDHLPECSQA